MNLRKFAIRGLIAVAVAVALCMFFSGTIRTITTAKVRLTQATSGRLEEEIRIDGKLVFPQVERIGVALEEGQTLTVTRVNVRPGYEVKAGDVVVEARVADLESALAEQQASYDEALDGLLALESKSRAIRLRPTDEQYAAAYFELRDAMKAAAAARIEMEALLAAEGLELPQSGAPEGASEVLRTAVEAWRAADAAQAQAQAAMDGAARYAPDEDTWSYITEKRDFEEKMAQAEESMAALRELDANVRAVCAPRDGYVAAVAVKAGDSYDGSGEMLTVTAADAAPVLRADVSQVDRTVSEGMPVTIEVDQYTSVETQVVATGLDSEGKRYADVEITPQVLDARGSVYAMTVEETPMSLVFRARETTALLPSSAVHGSGEDRYVFTVETSYSNLGNSRMTVRKLPVTVAGEADGVASVREEIGYYDIAYMEDRPINDGDAVMLYIE